MRLCINLIQLVLNYFKTIISDDIYMGGGGQAELASSGGSDLQSLSVRTSLSDGIFYYSKI